MEYKKQCHIETLKIFPKNMAFYRKCIGISQNELAKRMGVQAPVVARYETGGAVPRADTLMLIAKILGVTPDLLLGFQIDDDNRQNKKIVKITFKINESIRNLCEVRDEFLT